MTICFAGLNLLDVLSFMRKEEPDEDLLLQLEVSIYTVYSEAK